MNKPRVKNYSFGMLVLAGLAGFAAPSDAKAWDLICRGGGNANAITFSTWGTGNGLVAHFWKSDRPAGDGLLPGQCSWPDRGMWAAEPRQICLGNSISGSITISIQSNKTSAQSSDHRVATINAIFNLIGDPNYYYTFNVNSDGRSCLVAD
jgi:hypothetical protein